MDAHQEMLKARFPHYHFILFSGHSAWLSLEGFYSDRIEKQMKGSSDREGTSVHGSIYLCTNPMSCVHELDNGVRIVHRLSTLTKFVIRKEALSGFLSDNKFG